MSYLGGICMKFDKYGRKIGGTQRTINNSEVIHFGLDSEYATISSNAIDIARDMVHEKRIPEFLNLLKNLEQSLK